LNEEIVELGTFAVEAVEPHPRSLVKTRSSNPNKSREFSLVARRPRDIEGEFIRLLDSAVVVVIAGVVQFENSNRRDEHLDGIDRRLLSSGSLERLYSAMEDLACSLAETENELVARIVRILKGNIDGTSRKMSDELRNLVAMSS
jgi:hypothetical protein